MADYKLFTEQEGIVAERLKNLEQQHYNNSVSLRLFDITNVPLQDKTYTGVRKQQAQLEPLIAELKVMLEELESQEKEEKEEEEQEETE